MSGQVSYTFIQEALLRAEAAGVDVKDLLDRLGLRVEPEKRISADDYGALWFGIARAMGDEFFGLGAHPMRPGSFALMAHAVTATDTLDSALRLILRFMRVVVEEPAGRLLVRGDIAQIVLTDNDLQRSAFAYRTFLIIVLGLASWAGRRQIRLYSVSFSCPAPDRAGDYHQFFGVPVQFSEPETRVVFGAQDVSRPINRTWSALQTFIQSAPGNLLIGYPHRDGLQGKIRAQLEAVPALDWPEFDEIAYGLGMSASTLRRRLQSQGQDFRTIKSDLRRTMAKRLLRETNEPVASVAEKVGYAEPSAFYRAFKVWEDCCPTEFRMTVGSANPEEQ